jgi:hypothetical protein
MIKLLILITVVWSNLSLATPHPHIIQAQILRNNPKIDIKFAKKLRQAIFMSCLRHKIPCKIYTAILMQESKYKLGAVNRVTQDHGVAQINHKTAAAFGFDIERLTTDLEYSVDAGAQVLADFRRMYGKTEVDFWTRYNSSNPYQRAIYYELVTRYK